jgi:hypothetical protein
MENALIQSLVCDAQAYRLHRFAFTPPRSAERVYGANERFGEVG